MVIWFIKYCRVSERRRDDQTERGTVITGDDKDDDKGHTNRLVEGKRKVRPYKALRAIKGEMEGEKSKKINEVMWPSGNGTGPGTKRLRVPFQAQLCSIRNVGFSFHPKKWTLKKERNKERERERDDGRV